MNLKIRVTACGCLLLGCGMAFDGYAAAVSAGRSGGVTSAAASAGGSAGPLWVTPIYNHTSGDYNMDTYGMAVGYDFSIGDLSLGVGGTVSRSDYEYGATSFDADDATAAFYVSYRLPYDVTIGGTVGYGWTSYDQHRDFGGSRYYADYDSNMFFIGANVKRAFTLAKDFVVQPGIGYEFITIDTDGYTESAGPNALTVDSSTRDLHRFKLGADASYRVSDMLSLWGDAYYLGLYGDRKAENAVHFVGTPSGRFVSLGNALDPNSLGLGIGVTVKLPGSAGLSVGYNVLIGSHDTTSSVGFRVFYNW